MKRAEKKGEKSRNGWMFNFYELRVILCKITKTIVF